MNLPQLLLLKMIPRSIWIVVCLLTIHALPAHCIRAAIAAGRVTFLSDLDLLTFRPRHGDWKIWDFSDKVLDTGVVVTFTETRKTNLYQKDVQPDDHVPSDKAYQVCWTFLTIFGAPCGLRVIE